MMRNDLAIEDLGSDFFSKYLNCPNCKSAEFYCTAHKIEVELILAGTTE